MKKSTLRRLLVLLLAVAALTALRFLPVADELRPLLEWVRGLGPWGLPLLAVLYTPAALLLLPGSVLTLSLGFFYEPLPAFVAASLGSTTAAGVVFLFGRTVGRRRVEARLAGSPRVRALDAAVARNGFLIVLLTRLSP